MALRGPQSFESSVIIEKLSPLITEERMQKLQQVIANRSMSIAPVMEHLYDRGNLSAVMRSAEAYGYINMHIIDQPNGKFKASNRVTKGTDKWMLQTKHQSNLECVKDLKRQGFKIYCTHLETQTSIRDINFNQKAAVVFGNEKDGVTDEIVEASDGCFRLPMMGFAQSFNISVAAAITFSYIYEERQRAGYVDSLSDSDQEFLMALYLMRCVESPEKVLML